MKEGESVHQSSTAEQARVLRLRVMANLVHQRGGLCDGMGDYMRWFVGKAYLLLHCNSTRVIIWSKAMGEHGE